MQITPEILIRYHQGLASYEEIIAVAGWLEDDSFEPQLELPFQSPEKEAELCAQIWQRLVAHQKKRVCGDGQSH